MVLEGKMPGFSIDDDGVLRFENRLCVPNTEAVKREIVKEAYRSEYSVHPGATKMYQNLKQTFW